MVKTGPPKVVTGPPRLTPWPPTLVKKRPREPYCPVPLPHGAPWHMPGQKLGQLHEEWVQSPLGKAWALAQERFNTTHLDQIIYCKDAYKSSYVVADFGKFLDHPTLRHAVYRIAVIQKNRQLGAPYLCDD